MRKIGQDHLTTLDEGLDLKAAHTYPGQAHFAEPTSGHSCGRCASFETLTRNDQRGRCSKAASFAMKSLFGMPVFPAAATACKFWQEAGE